MTKKFLRKPMSFSPATLVLGSFLLLIAIGATLLKLELATVSGEISWIDAIFTATSAVCVTGLVVVDTGSFFTPFGQLVILLLIQIGGLGVMTISVALFSWIGHSVSLSSRLAMQDIFAHAPRRDIYQLVRSVIFFTLTTEAVGAGLLALHWSGEMPWRQALYSGVFHAVSAFCNAGFALFPEGLAPYSGNWLLNLTICLLIVTGGIGFPVLYDLHSRFLSREHRAKRLAVQTKTVLLTTALLIVGGALMFALLETPGTVMANRTPGEWLLIPLFQSITCRTAGFNTVDIGALREATIVMMLFLMFVGASPGSCGGGVKTTTLAILANFTVSRIRHRKRVNFFKKSLPEATVTKVMSLIVLSMAVISLVVFMLLISDTFIEVGGGSPAAKIHALQYLFETVSAFATVGLSMGITAALSSWDKAWIIAIMIVGRVGVLTFSYIIVGNSAGGKEYSEENMMIG